MGKLLGGQESVRLAGPLRGWQSVTSELTDFLKVRLCEPCERGTCGILKRWLASQHRRGTPNHSFTMSCVGNFFCRFCVPVSVFASRLSLGRSAADSCASTASWPSNVGDGVGWAGARRTV